MLGLQYSAQAVLIFLEGGLLFGLLYFLSL